MAMKQVIVLERSVGDTILTTGVVWVAVPASYQAIVARPDAVSQFTLATSAEVALLQVGSIAEVVFRSEMSKSSTLVQQKAEFLRTASLLTVQYLSSQAISLQYYGVYYDGAWSA